MEVLARPLIVTAAVTILPNAILDEFLPRLTPGALKALLHLYRLRGDWEALPEADVEEIAEATGESADDLLLDLLTLKNEQLVCSRIALPGDREVYWLAAGGE